MKLLLVPFNVHLSTRGEKAGPKTKVPAATLTLTSTLGESALRSLFDTDTRWENFRAFCWDDNPEKTLTRNLSGSIALPQMIVGGEAKLHLEMESKSIELDKMTIDNLVITPLEGGSADVKCRIQCHPEPEQIAVLYSLPDREWLITAQRKQADLEAEAEKAAEQLERGGKVTSIAKGKQKPKEDEPLETMRLDDEPASAAP